MCARLAKPDLILFTLMARHLWFRRNLFIHKDKFQSPTFVCRIAIQALEDFQ